MSVLLRCSPQKRAGIEINQKMQLYAFPDCPFRNDLHIYRSLSSTNISAIKVSCKKVKSVQQQNLLKILQRFRRCFFFLLYIIMGLFVSHDLLLIPILSRSFMSVHYGCSLGNCRFVRGLFFYYYFPICIIYKLTQCLNRAIATIYTYVCKIV